ncbi:hypothetical protein C8R47DRAFT_1323611 [Mycena vitilis]|nr:hypothetical protein C8R47DRAFT_1323611 [Mycena vitilis]
MSANTVVICPYHGGALHLANDLVEWDGVSSIDSRCFLLLQYWASPAVSASETLSIQTATTASLMEGETPTVPASPQIVKEAKTTTLILTTATVTGENPTSTALTPLQLPVNAASQPPIDSLAIALALDMDIDPAALEPADVVRVYGSWNTKLGFWGSSESLELKVTEDFDSGNKTANRAARVAPAEHCINGELICHVIRVIRLAPCDNDLSSGLVVMTIELDSSVPTPSRWRLITARAFLVVSLGLTLAWWWRLSAAIRPRAPSSSPENSDSTRAQLLGLILDVNAAQSAVYGAKDDQGHTMDTAKIIQAPEGDYFAVYHSLRADGRFHSSIATSTDLASFRFVADFGAGSSQPTIFSVGDGSYVVAWEQDPANHIAVRYFSDREHLLAATPTRAFDTPMTLSACAEGTPSIYSATLSPDIDHSSIDIVDRQQRGILTNFTHWVTAPVPEVDNAILHWGARGNIGGRDPIVFEQFTFQLMEGAFAYGDFGSFRTFVYDFATGNAERVNVTTKAGSTAFANPSISRVLSPQGRNALAVGLFLPNEGAAVGEGGQLIYYREY